MKKEWALNAFFAALTGASVYYVQLTMTERGVSRLLAFAAVLACGIVVGVVLRYALTELPLKFHFVRQWLLEAAAIEGLWLEVLDRQGEQHYSIFRFKYDTAGDGAPYSMSGDSFFPGTETHSVWSTRYVSTHHDPGGLFVEYIYGAEYKGHDATEKGERKYGYGESRFKFERNPTRLIGGSGFYLAVEKNPPFRCTYDLHHIDPNYKIKVGAANEALDSEDSMKRFIHAVHRYYLETSNRQ